MSGNDDGPAALGHERPAGTMNRHDVLALRAGTKREARGPPKQVQDRDDGGRGGQHEAHEG